MRLFVAALAACVCVGTSALAADLPAPIYTKAPVFVDPGYNWSGFYVGGNLGYSWGRSSDTSTLANGAGTALFTSTGGSNLDGIVGGGQAGDNWQMQNWVWGLEADIQGTGEKGERDFNCPTGVCTPSTIAPGFHARVILDRGAAVPVSMDQKIDWFGTVRARAGVLLTPKVLLYATGGLAYGEVNTRETIGASAFSASDIKVGYAVGAGIEGAIGGNWTMKLEYLYVDLGRTSGSFATTIPAFGAGVVANGTLASAFSSRITDNVLRLGLNYRFNDPVVARY
jgi:outer membrane immunogenic protein